MRGHQIWVPPSKCAVSAITAVARFMISCIIHLVDRQTDRQTNVETQLNCESDNLGRFLKCIDQFVRRPVRQSISLIQVIRFLLIDFRV